MDRWEEVSPEAAKSHPLYGVNGWLIFPMLGMFFTPIIMAVTFYQILTSADYSQLPKLYVNVVMVELAVNAAVGLWAWTNLWLIFSKRRAAVRSMITILAVFPLLVLVDAIVVKYMVEYLGGSMSWVEVLDPDTLRTLTRSVVGAGIWIPYMLQSRRVNVTFLHRVRPNDPIAAPSNF